MMSYWGLSKSKACRLAQQHALDIHRLRLFGCKVLFDQLHDYGSQQEHGDQVGNGHETVEGVADAPDQAQIHGGAHDGNQGIGNVERQQDLAAQQELSAAGTVKTPAHNGGESKAAHGNGSKNGHPVAVDRSKSANGQLRAGSLAVGNLHTAEQNDQCGHGADDDGIHKDLENAEHTLLHRLIGVGAGMGSLYTLLLFINSESRRLFSQKTAALSSAILTIFTADTPSPSL